METGEERAASRAERIWLRLLPFGQSIFESNRRGVLLTFGFFWVAFLGYYFTHADQTYFRDFVHLANAFLHGRLDVANAEELPNLNWALYKGKYYVVEPLMPAVILMPGVAIYGVALNQTLASVFIGGLNASAVHRLMRGLTEKVSVQVWLTLLFVFGTPFWWVATDGSTSQFSHVVAVLFLFLAIYQTLVAKAPFTAGLLLGAAHLSRLTTILTLPFFIIMFADLWLPVSNERSLLKRINLRPLRKLGAGVAIFVGLGMVYNYIAYETPLPSGMNYYAADPGGRVSRGLFDIKYITNHLPILFKAMPVFRSEPPYVLETWLGAAFWVTTPAFLYAFFAGVKNKVVIRAWMALLAVTIAVIVLSNSSPGGFKLPFNLDLPYNLELYPFALLVLSGLFIGLRDRLVLACWLAIIPVALVHFTFGLTEGWPQFGYRFALDYSPFLFLLTVKAFGDRIMWHHKLFILAAIAVNLWGVVWLFKFHVNNYLGFEWVIWG